MTKSRTNLQQKNRKDVTLESTWKRTKHREKLVEGLCLIPLINEDPRQAVVSKAVDISYKGGF